MKKNLSIVLLTRQIIFFEVTINDNYIGGIDAGSVKLKNLNFAALVNGIMVKTLQLLPPEVAHKEISSP